MMHLFAKYSKAQLKIQQMAFVLIAFMIFFALVGLFYVSLKTSSIRDDAGELRRERIRETVRSMSGSPELQWTNEDCSACIDLDKAMALKSRESYNGFWGKDVSLLQLRRVYPAPTRIDLECTSSNYPDCSQVTLWDGPGEYITEEAFVALCRFDEGLTSTKCELGKIIMGVNLP